MDFTNVYQISDERFSIEQIENYDLFIEAHSNRFKFILREKASKIIIWLEDHYFGPLESEEEYLQKIKDLFNNHLFLKANFWNSIEVLSDAPFFCLIPNDFFNPLLSENYLKAHFSSLETSDFQIKSDKIGNQNLVFGFPKKLISVFEEIYAQKEIFYSLSIINAVKYFEKDQALHNKNILVLSDTWIEAIVKNPITKDLKIEKLSTQSNSFLDVLGRIEKEGELKNLIFGEITPFSNIYKVIKQKLKALEFGTIPKGTKLSQYFEELPEQRYFTLFANH